MLLTGIVKILFVGAWLTLVACAPVRQTLPLVPVSTPEPTVFITSNLTIVPDSIRPGDSSTIGVTVTNSGEQPGTYRVVLMVNGSAAETQDVTLAGGASQSVIFIFTTFFESDYEVTIDQLKGILEVRVGV